MHATEAQTADGYFRMESNSSPSLEIQTGFPRVEGGRLQVEVSGHPGSMLCQWDSTGWQQC